MCKKRFLLSSQVGDMNISKQKHGDNQFLRNVCTHQHTATHPHAATHLRAATH